MRTAGLGMGAVRCALWCYPAWWRRRYGAEQEELAGELAAEGRSCWLMAAGLAAGSVRARVTGAGMPPVAELIAWAMAVLSPASAQGFPPNCANGGHRLFGLATQWVHLGSHIQPVTWTTNGERGCQTAAGPS